MKLFVAIYLTIAILWHAYDIAGNYRKPYTWRDQAPIIWTPHILMLLKIWTSTPWH